MKLGTLVLSVLMSAGLAFAQAAQTTTPSTAPSAQQKQDRMARRQQMMQQHQQHMQEAQAKIDKLKADLAKVSDPATKQALQDDADMWQMMLDHMNSMMSGGMMGHGMMHHGKGMGMGKGMGCAGMGNPPADKSTQGEPPAQNPK